MPGSLTSEKATPSKTAIPDSHAMAVGMEEHGARRHSTIVAEPEQLERRFNSTSMLAACVSLMATWEAISSTMVTGLVSGGPVSLIYGFIRK